MTAAEAGALAAAMRVLKAIDGSNEAGFAALSAETKPTGLRELTPKEVAASLADLHNRFGQRPHTFEPPVELPGEVRPTAEVEVSFGPGEIGLRLSFQADGSGAWKLVRFSNAPAKLVPKPEPEDEPAPAPSPEMEGK